MKELKFVIRKYVNASDVKQALEREPDTPVHEVYLKDDSDAHDKFSKTNAVGFTIPAPSEDESLSRKQRR